MGFIYCASSKELDSKYIVGLGYVTSLYWSIICEVFCKRQSYSLEIEICHEVSNTVNT